MSKRMAPGVTFYGPDDLADLLDAAGLNDCVTCGVRLPDASLWPYVHCPSCRGVETRASSAASVKAHRERQAETERMLQAMVATYDPDAPATIH